VTTRQYECILQKRHTHDALHILILTLCCFVTSVNLEYVKRPTAYQEFLRDAADLVPVSEFFQITEAVLGAFRADEFDHDRPDLSVAVYELPLTELSHVEQDLLLWKHLINPLLNLKIQLFLRFYAYILYCFEDIFTDIVDVQRGFGRGNVEGKVNRVQITALGVAY
jgi:hypothetical protein